MVGWYTTTTTTTIGSHSESDIKLETVIKIGGRGGGLKHFPIWKKKKLILKRLRNNNNIYIFFKKDLQQTKNTS